MPSHDPFDDEVLPLYGDAEDDYDTDLCVEIEKEKREGEQQPFFTRGLLSDTVNTALEKELVRRQARGTQNVSPLAVQPLPLLHAPHRRCCNTWYICRHIPRSCQGISQRSE
ncbi:hypothetical protein F5B18DRAFT_640279 [Nemania serpens]|nr:hypothetical protein F5B18DRAFT_640279 [Nemania serpens]